MGMTQLFGPGFAKGVFTIRPGQHGLFTKFRLSQYWHRLKRFSTKGTEENTRHGELGGNLNDLLCLCGLCADFLSALRVEALFLPIKFSTANHRVRSWPGRKIQE